MTSTGATLYRLAAGSERVHRQADLASLGITLGRGARRRPGWYAAAVFIVLFALPPVMLLAPTFTALAVVGGMVGWERLQTEGVGTAKGRWMTGRRVLAGAGAVIVSGLLLLAIVPSRLVALLLVGAVTFLIWKRVPRQFTPWWSHKRLAPALVQAGVVRRPGAKEKPVKVLYRGKPRTDELGTAVTFTLPGVSWTKVEALRVDLAAALHVPSRLVVVSHEEDDPASVVTVWVGAVRPAVKVRSPLADVERTVWAEPVRVGTDERGHPITLDTDEANTLVGGTPGSGKSNTARVIVAHYLLDPTTVLYGLDGKGSAQDWGAARPMFARWVSGTSEDAAEQLEQMLGEVLATIRQRNATDVTVKDPGVLLLLEELQDVRAAADKPARERIDSLLGRIIRMGRAVETHVLISTQRPSVDDVPSGVRNLVTQRLALMLRNGADAALVLGLTPALALPAKRGQGLLTTPQSTRPVTLDLLDQQGWTAVCRRARKLRGSADDFGRAVNGVLLANGPQTATRIWEQLPEALQPATVTALGMALAQLSGVEQYRRGNDRVWRVHVDATEGVRAAPKGARGAHRLTLATRPPVHPDHAQTAAVGDVA